MERELWVTAALPFEGAALARRLGGVREAAGRGYSIRGVVAGHPLRLVVTGPGAYRVERAYLSLRSRRDPPRAILSTGVGGALRTGLAPGALVLASEIVAIEGTGTRRVGTIDSRLAAATSRALEGSGLVWERAPVLACNQVIASGEDKARAGRQSGAAVVQMEDHTWAERAGAEAIPFLSLRCVIDTVSHDIVPAATEFPWRGATPWKVLKVLARHPASIPALVELRGAQKTAAATLATWAAAPLDAIVAELGED